MALLPYPPSERDAWASLRLTDPIAHGWPVFAVQKALNDAAGAKLTADGAFGKATDEAVRAFQRRMFPTDTRQWDGIVGPRTKALLVEATARRVDREDEFGLDQLPDGLMRALGRYEGADNPSAINEYDPPGGTPGTDCGCMQLRCLIVDPDGSYDMSDLRIAFSPYDAMLVAAGDFKRRKNHYLTYGWTRNNRVRAEKCALFAHNWPVGANDIAFEGRLTNPDSEAVWVPDNVRMLDGTVVNTRAEWANFYAGMWQTPASIHQGPMPKSISWGV